MKNSGSTVVSAQYQGVISHVNFIVSSKVITSLSLSLSSSISAIGMITSSTVIGHYSDSSTDDITGSVDFISSDNSIAVVSNSNLEKGSINSLNLGEVTITASLGGISSSVQLSVSSISLSSIRVETSSSLLSAGINAYFFAFGIYSDGSEIDITNNVNWTLSDIAYGSISNVSETKGLYTNTFIGNSTGNLDIDAEYAGVVGSLNIILAPGSIAGISITPLSAVKNTNKNFEYRAFANFTDGASVEITNIVTWESSDLNAAIISNGKNDTGLLSTITEGTVGIVASYKGLSSLSSSLIIDNEQAELESDNGTGLSASYYSGNNFDTLEGQRVDSQVNFNWAQGSAPLGVGDNFSVRWEGEIKGKFTGDCTIASRSDDGFRVYINELLVIDVWFAHAPRWDYNYSVPFIAGEKQVIKIEFFENGGHAVAELYWQCPGDVALEAIPTEYLFN